MHTTEPWYGLDVTHERVARDKRELAERAQEAAEAARSGVNVVVQRKLRAQEERLAELRSGAQPRRTGLTGAELSYCAHNGIEPARYLAQLNGETR